MFVATAFLNMRRFEEKLKNGYFFIFRSPISVRELGMNPGPDSGLACPRRGIKAPVQQYLISFKQREVKLWNLYTLQKAGVSKMTPLVLSHYGDTKKEYKFTPGC